MAGSPFDLTGSRLQDNVRANLENEDTPHTGWVKTNDFIVCAMVEAGAHASGDGTLQLRWRNATDLGTFGVLSGTGELTWTADTDLANGTAVSVGEEVCTPDATVIRIDGVEREGANDVSTSVANDEYVEHQWAVDSNGAGDAKEYEFEIYDATEGAAVGTCLATMTTEAGAVTTTVIALKGLLQYKGYLPVTRGIIVKPAFKGLLQYKGYVPIARTAATVSPFKGLLWWKGYTPVIQAIKTIIPFKGLLQYKGYLPVTLATKTKTAFKGLLLYKGYVPTLTVTKIVTKTVSKGLLLYKGYVPTADAFVPPVTVTPSIGILTYKGYTPGVYTGPKVETWTVQDSGAPTSTGIPLTKPSGVEHGDLLLLICYADIWNDAQNWEDFDPANWNFELQAGDNSSNCKTAIYWRIADGSEAATVTPTISDPFHIVGWYLRISNVDTGAPFHKIGTVDTSGITDSITAPTLTTTRDNCLGLYTVGFDGGNGLPFSLDDDRWTETDADRNATSGTDGTAGWGERELADAVATGTLTITAANVGGGMLGVQWAIASPLRKVQGSSGLLQFKGNVPTADGVSAANIVSPFKGLLQYKGYVPVTRGIIVKATFRGLYQYKGYVPSADAEIGATVVSPFKGLLQYKGYVPVTTGVARITPFVGLYQYKGYVPVTTGVARIAPFVGLYQYKGYTPTITATKTVIAARGLYLYKGYVPFARATKIVTPTRGLYQYKGYVPSTLGVARIAPFVGLYQYKGYIPTTTAIKTKAPTRGLYQYKGYVPTFTVVKTVQVEPFAGLYQYKGYVPVARDPAIKVNRGLFYYVGKVPTVVPVRWEPVDPSIEAWSAVSASTETWSSVASLSTTWSAR